MKIKAAASFNGCSIKSDGTVSLSFKIPYSDLAEALKSVMLIDRVMTCGFLVEEKPLPIGKATFGSISIDREGESTLKIETSIDLIRVQVEDLQQVVKAPCSLVMSVKDEANAEA